MQSGGEDVRKVTRKKCLDKGAPLRVAKGRSSKAKKQHGNRQAQRDGQAPCSDLGQWLNRQNRLLKARDGSMTRPEYLARVASLRERWDSGDRGDVVSEASSDVEVDPDLRRYRAEVESYDALIGDDLFGTSTEAMPFNPEHIAAVVQRDLEARGGQMPTRTFGLTKRLANIREGFVRSSFCQDIGQIPAKRRVDYEHLCHHMHPGVCKCEVTAASADLHHALYRVVGAWPMGTLFAVQASYADRPLDQLAPNELPEEMLKWHRVKGSNAKDGFCCAKLKTHGPFDKPSLDWDQQEVGVWNFQMSQRLALDVTPPLNPPEGSEQKFLIACSVIRYEIVSDPSSMAEAARCIPECLGAEHVSEVARSVLFPVAARPRSCQEKENPDQKSAREFHNLMRKGFKDCPMPSFDLDMDAHGAEGEDEIQVALMEKAMGHVIKQKRGQQRKQRMRSTAKTFLGKKRALPADREDVRGRSKKKVCM